jgi:opacity protein-like surface antigen
MRNTMVRATEGAALGNVKYTVNGFTDDVTSNATRTGWVVGGAAEWLTRPNSLLRAEYLYYNINSNVTGTAPYVPAFGNFGQPVFACQNYNVPAFRIADCYKF